LRQVGDALMLPRDSVGLLLHHGVEQQHTEYADRENQSEAGGKGRLTTSRSRRTRRHRKFDDDRT
jgi:hypothetical protein